MATHGQNAGFPAASAALPLNTNVLLNDMKAVMAAPVAQNMAPSKMTVRQEHLKHRGGLMMHLEHPLLLRRGTRDTELEGEARLLWSSGEAGYVPVTRTRNRLIPVPGTGTAGRLVQ